MLTQFALILYFGSVTVNPVVINFESGSLCEKERARVEKYYYMQGFTNIKGVCIQTKE